MSVYELRDHPGNSLCCECESWDAPPVCFAHHAVRRACSRYRRKKIPNDVYCDRVPTAILCLDRHSRQDPMDTGCSTKVPRQAINHYRSQGRNQRGTRNAIEDVRDFQPAETTGRFWNLDGSRRSRNISPFSNGLRQIAQQCKILRRRQIVRH